jgi:hypothetical protein
MTVNPNVVPTINIGTNSNTTLCAGTSITFNTTTTNGGNAPAYQWKVNGVNVGTSANSYTYTPANGDSVRCVFMSNAQCVTTSSANSNTINMTVNPVVTPTIGVSSNPSTAICAGTIVTYTAAITNGGSTPVYQWKVNGVNVGTSANSYTYTPSNGDVIVCALTSNVQCATSSVVNSSAINMTVTPYATPVISINPTPGATVCAGTNVTYSATTTNGGNAPTYQWKVNGVNVGIGANSFSYTPTDLDSVRCVLTSNAQCIMNPIATSNTVNMTVNPIVNPIVNLSITPTDTVCAGTSVTCNAMITNGGATPAYQWKVNGINVGASLDNYTYAPADGDSIRCELTSSATCPSSTTVSSGKINMVVKPYLTPTINISVSPSDKVCTGTNVSFSATATGGTTPTYQWTLNGVVIGTSSAILNITPTNADSVRCVLNSNYQCATTTIANSNTVDMIVDTFITPTISLSAPAKVLVGNPVTVDAVVTNAGSNYTITWFNNGVMFSTTNLPTTTYTKIAGTDSITAKIVSTSQGCYNTTLSDAVIVQTDNMGVGNIEGGSGIYVYPNPVKNVLHIDKIQTTMTYKILDIVGATIQAGKLNKGDNNIAIQEISSGMYMLELQDNDGNKEIRKMVKE